eukprot:gene8600-biopygen14750
MFRELLLLGWLIALLEALLAEGIVRTTGGRSTVGSGFDQFVVALRFAITPISLLFLGDKGPESRTSADTTIFLIFSGVNVIGREGLVGESVSEKVFSGDG